MIVINNNREMGADLDFDEIKDQLKSPKKYAVESKYAAYSSLNLAIRCAIIIITAPERERIDFVWLQKTVEEMNKYPVEFKDIIALLKSRIEELKDLNYPDIKKGRKSGKDIHQFRYRLYKAFREKTKFTKKAIYEKVAEIENKTLSQKFPTTTKAVKNSIEQKLYD